MLCIYHADCIDGAFAAYCVQQQFPDITMYPAYHENTQYPSVEGEHIYIVDFCYSKAVLEKMISDGAKSITILDHHLSSLEDVKDYIVSEEDIRIPHTTFYKSCKENNTVPIRAYFDMARSGAGITHDTFNDKKNRIPLLTMVERQDTKIGADRRSAAVATFLYSYEVTPDLFRNIIASYPGHRGLQQIVTVGMHLLRMRTKQMRQLSDRYRIVEINGIEMYAANTAAIFSIAVAKAMAKKHVNRVGLAYHDDGLGLQFKIVSIEGGPNVGALAKLYGGGGHKHIAGFYIPHKNPNEILKI